MQEERKRPLLTTTNNLKTNDAGGTTTNKNANTNATSSSSSSSRASGLLQKRKFSLGNKTAPPPMTASMRRLEQLLDEDDPSSSTSTSKNKKKKPSKRPKNNQTTSTTVRQQQQQQQPQSGLHSLSRALSQQQQQQRPKNALAFRGGLASAPTFRKASLLPRKSAATSKMGIILPPGTGGSSKKERSSVVATVPLPVKPAAIVPMPPPSIQGTKERRIMVRDNNGFSSSEVLVLTGKSDDSNDGHNEKTNFSMSTTTTNTTMDTIPMTNEKRKVSSSSAPSQSADDDSMQVDGGNDKTEPRTIMTPKQHHDSIRPISTSTTTNDNNNNNNNMATTTTLRIGLQLGRKSQKQKPFSRSSTSSGVSQRKKDAPTTTTRTTPLDPSGGDDGNEQQGHEEMDDTMLLLPPPPSSLFLESKDSDKPSSSSSSTTTKLSGTASTTKPPTTSFNNSSSNNNSKNSSLRRASATSVVNNDNFVRLNLRNSAGACKGARNKKLRRSSKYDDYKNKYNKYDNANKHSDDDDDNDSGNRRIKASTTTGTSQGQSYVSRMTGLDPLDDFLDGVYGSSGTGPKKKEMQATKNTTSTNQEDPAPICARHQRPCKLIVVKKNTKGNKGRKFYACSMPRGEQCDHFQWAEDTIEAARRTVTDNASHSSFISRQVKAHVDRFRPLTIPELQEEAMRRRLNKSGKKSQLLLRLAVWARDEIAKAVPYPDDEKENDEKDVKALVALRPAKVVELEDSYSDEDSSSSSDDDDDDESSEDELELFDGDDDQDDEDSEMEDSETPEESSEPEVNALTKEESESTAEESSLLSNLQSLFGHSNFRDGQEWAIQRCLDGKKSLLVAPTGFGKSLCYALPAALMDGVCVVVSPLISLIQDQLRSLPPRIPAATLSGSVSASATAAILDDVVRKRIKILFVSPERLTSPSFRRLFYTKWNAETKQQERRFPEISLLCIDEAHCVSQWAHNFRPCFLRFKGLLHLMKPQSVLAVTATAGPRVIQDISNTLGIQSEVPAENSSLTKNENILVIDKSRDNIDVSCHFVENHEERIDMLSKILKPNEPAARSKKCKYAGVLAEGAVIVYVWRQRDTEVVAENLLSAGVSGGVVMYHGGMDASARTKAQSKFMRGKARICVATVAFGMGIDKADVVGIIHVYLSSSPEHYLQEIGRAGRDGRQAQAIALPTLEEIPIRHSLVHSNFISKSQIRALLFALKRIVDDFNCQDGARSLNIAIPVETMVLECDCKMETIETLLSILEQHGGDNPLLHVEGFNYDKATIALKKRSLEKLAEKEQLAACIQRVATCCDPPIGGEREDQAEVSHQKTESFQRHFLAYSQGSYAFSVAKCANAMGPSAESRHVFAALRRLQSSSELELALDTSAKGRVILVKISEEGLSFFNDGRLDELIEDLTGLLYDSFSSSVLSGADKVLDINYILDSVCTAGHLDDDGPTKLKAGKSSSLLKFQELVKTYFSQGLKEETDQASRRILPKRFFTIRQHELENDLYALIRDLPILAKQAPDSAYSPVLGDSKFPDYTAAATAKFLHGLDSPRAPAPAFRGHPLFGKWREVQFCYLQEAIGKLLKMPTTR